MTTSDGTAEPARIAAADRAHRTVHAIEIGAPAARVYDWIADVQRWPAVFGPTLFVEHLARGPGSEQFRIWASVHGAVSTWTSRRTLDPHGLRIAFRQENPHPPVAAMGGEWRFLPVGGDRTRVELVHEFHPAEGTPGARAWIERALDTNSEAELAALRRVCEFGHPADALSLSFEDTLAVAGSIEQAYRFVQRADAWPQLLPHVRDVVLVEAPDGVQDLQMDTRTADGSVHHTRSTRLCTPPQRIAYKQHVVPDLLHGHSGVWTFTPDRSGGGTIAARHSAVIDPTRIEAVLGTGKTLADARAFLREALAGNSRVTMNHAADHAALPLPDPAGGRAKP